MKRSAPTRLPLVALALGALVAGMWGGLLRLGWALPAPHATWATLHGPLMVSGFLGTVIGLERAVALSRTWAYAGPALTAAGALGMLLGPLTGPAPILACAGSASLVAVSVAIFARHRALFTATMGLGALAWLVGNVLWLAGWPVHRVVLWWATFLVLTIAGERLDLSRLLDLSRATWAAFCVAAALLAGGAILTTVNVDLAFRVAGAGALALALWLWRCDIARRTVRAGGLTRYIAVCLLLGYTWLGASGLMMLMLGGRMAGPAYDALLHALFVGFVFSMIFGHAPLVLAALTGVRVAFRPAFYGHAVLLHAGLVLRVAADLAGWTAGRQWGGMLNVVAVLLFVAGTALAVWRARHGPRPAVRT